MKKIEIQDIWISLTILLNMSLLQQYFAWDFSKNVQVRDWSHSHPQSLYHDLLEQSSIRLCHGTKTSCLGVPTRVPITKSLPSSSTFNTLIWKKEDDL